MFDLYSVIFVIWEVAGHQHQPCCGWPAWPMHLSYLDDREDVNPLSPFLSPILRPAAHSSQVNFSHCATTAVVPRRTLRQP